MATAFESMTATANIAIGSVLQRTFGAIGRNAGGFIALAVLLVGLPNFAMQYFLYENVQAGAFGTILSPLYWLSVLIGMIVSYLLQGAIVEATIRDQSGRPADIVHSAGMAIRLLPSIIGVAILSSVLMMVGFALLVVPGIIVYVMLIVAVPALMEEQGGVIASLRRSRELTRGSRWRIFGLIVTLGILYLLATVVIGGIAAVLVDLTNPLAFAVLNAINSTVMGVFSAALAACLYFELRTVKEGATGDDLTAIFA